MFAARGYIIQRLTSPSRGADIGPFTAFGQNMLLSFLTQATHGSGTPTVSRAVQQEEHLNRSCTKNVHCVAPAQTCKAS
ncbi:hypothetical protein PoB_002797400 [Plakobranchus ocellatus]|uniref:Uncharacterized protein n=1 Tax=Plakobranchus ocellatus TaxID=259542 RepID=A0AAV4A5F1_9GAST|nr:hypothetical protein PoB_002797400 [Plakobranchus ocellatus]